MRPLYESIKEEKNEADKMAEDEAVKQLQYLKNRKIGCGDWLINCKDRQAIETILAELEKKDKIIELMIKHLCDVINNDSDASLLPFCDSDDNLEEKVKKYFERRSENE